MKTWNDTQPIFIQIRQIIIDLILRGEGKDDEALPSVRQISAELSVNPLTVTKAYQSLVELGVIEKRRGLGMFLTPKAREKLLRHEREKFLSQEWPRIVAQIKSLELNIADLVSEAEGGKSDDSN
ncbi:MAG TPA: GntR family transcriptional regulator [Devosia sp.]|nr:GntR family transcriptional regulator [Devosia sp.]